MVRSDRDCLRAPSGLVRLRSMQAHLLSRVSGAAALPVILIGLAGLAGCGGKSKGSSTEGLITSDADSKVPVVDTTLCDTEGKRVVTSDLDRDNRPDVWKLYKTTKEGETTVEVLSCKQVDFNHDGQKDYVVGYTHKGATSFEKYDFDFDGRFDAFFQYNEKTGKVFEIQRESGFDGRYDIQEIYDDSGTLTTVKQDRNGDGEPDRWEQYDKGRLVAILYDEDFDKKVDRREEAKQEGPAKPSAGNDTATSNAEEAEESEAPDEGAGDGADADKAPAPAPAGAKK